MRKNCGDGGELLRDGQGYKNNLCGDRENGNEYLPTYNSLISLLYIRMLHVGNNAFSQKIEDYSLR